MTLAKARFKWCVEHILHIPTTTVIQDISNADHARSQPPASVSNSSSLRVYSIEHLIMAILVARMHARWYDPRYFNTVTYADMFLHMLKSLKFNSAGLANILEN